jgi:hypothetical protein
MGNQIEIIVLIETGNLLPVKQCLERCDYAFRVKLASNIDALRRQVVSKKYDCIVSATESPSIGDIIGLQLAYDPPIPVVLLPQKELEFLDNLNYEQLAGRIRRKVEKSKARESRRQNDSHGKPVVFVRDDEIYVKGADGKIVFWGCESSDSYGVAETMGLELVAIDYVRDRLAEAVSDITEELYHSDLDPENVSDIVYEGFLKLLLCFRDLDMSLGHRLGNYNSDAFS